VWVCASFCFGRGVKKFLCWWGDGCCLFMKLLSVVWLDFFGVFSRGVVISCCVVLCLFVLL
jgi:hypothetical protein